MVHQKKQTPSHTKEPVLPNSTPRFAPSFWRREALAGTVSFFAIVYIIIVNSSILADAGIPQEAGIIATILASAVGCFVMALWGKAPLIIAPGMGINAMFTYTLVQGMGLTWQQALAVSMMSGICFLAISLTSLVGKLREAIPASLQEAISVGIGLMLVLIGLHKGGVILPDSASVIAVQSFGKPGVIVTLATLALTCILYMRKVPGNLLLSIIGGTVLAFLFGIKPSAGSSLGGFTWSSYGEIFGHLTFKGLPVTTLIVAVFSLTLVIVFENVGLINAQLNMSEKPERFKQAMQATSFSVFLSGIFGTSPTVSTVEAAAGISSGGRTGCTSAFTGILFLISLIAMPVITLVPDQAVAPILIFIGGLMMPSVRNISFESMEKGLPAFFIIAFIPLMHSIVDGIAIGFISYSLFHVAVGKWREVKPLFYFISLLFVLHFVLQVI